MSAKASVVASALAVALMTTPVHSQSATFFKSLDGTWSGAGKVRLDNGKSEAIKCKGYYNAKKSGEALGIAIDCASAAIRINMRANLVEAAGKVTGTWEEREFNQSGQVNGSTANNKLSLTFAGGLSGSLSIATIAGRQTVTISTGGPGFIGADLTFSKG